MACLMPSHIVLNTTYLRADLRLYRQLEQVAKIIQASFGMLSPATCQKTLQFLCYFVGEHCYAAHVRVS